MPIFFKCPGCSVIYRLHEDHSGRAAICPCGARFRVPGMPESDETGEKQGTAGLLAEQPDECVSMPDADGFAADEVAAEVEAVADADSGDFADAFEGRDGRDEAVMDAEEAGDEPDSDGLLTTESESAGMDEEPTVEAVDAPEADDAGDAEEFGSGASAPDDEDAPNADAREEDGTDEFDVVEEGSRSIFGRILLLLAIGGIAASFFLPVWNLPAGWNTPEGQAALSKHFSASADNATVTLAAPVTQTSQDLLLLGGALDPVFYALGGGVFFGLVLFLLAIAGKRAGAATGLLLTLLAVAGVAAGLAATLRAASGAPDLMSALNSFVIPDQAALMALPGLLALAGGLVCLLLGGLLCSFGLFRRCGCSAGRESTGGDSRRSVTVQKNQPGKKTTITPSRKSRDMTPDFIKEPEEQAVDAESDEAEQDEDGAEGGEDSAAEEKKPLPGKGKFPAGAKLPAKKIGKAPVKPALKKPTVKKIPGPKKK